MSRGQWFSILAATVATVGSAHAQAVGWPYYGGDPGAMRYSPLAEINRDNVRTLRVAWTWDVRERPYNPPVAGRKAWPGSFEATPLMFGDTLFLTTPYNRVVALDAGSGAELWSFDPLAYAWGQPYQPRTGFVHRGLAAWSDGRGRRLFLATRWRLMALDASTGRVIRSFGHGGEIDLTDAIGWNGDHRHIHSTSPPAIYRDIVIVGSSIPDDITYPGDPPGTVVGVDARSGRVRWTFHTIPHDGEAGYRSWKNRAADRAGHTNVWSIMTVDTVRGLVYLPVSAASNDWYGVDRPGDNLFAESIVCLDARTGRRVWHFQLVHHGLWDYDLAAPPMLVTVRHDGKAIDAVVVAGKTGFVYVFDRVTGRPLWPIEERPAPQTGVPGEPVSPTQPIPTRPKPFAKQGFTPEDVIDFTPELKRAALEQLKQYRFGPLFTPPSFEGSLVLPGWYGGAAWGGGSYDPETQTYYVRGNNHPVLARLVHPAARSDTVAAEYVMDALNGEPGIVFPARRGVFARLAARRDSAPPPLPINKPPYGTLNALDLTTGEYRWQVPVGDMPEVRNHPALRNVPLPRRLGSFGVTGPLVTGGGLVFMSDAGTSLYAFDKNTGEEVWEAKLGERGYGNPMTYRTRDGRQFVVVAVGEAKPRLMAFALPGR